MSINNETVLFLLPHLHFPLSQLHTATLPTYCISCTLTLHIHDHALLRTHVQHSTVRMHLFVHCGGQLVATFPFPFPSLPPSPPPLHLSFLLSIRHGGSGLSLSLSGGLWLPFTPIVPVHFLPSKAVHKRGTVPHSTGIDKISS